MFFFIFFCRRLFFDVFPFPLRGQILFRLIGPIVRFEAGVEITYAIGFYVM
jgi:hypothetical protein